MRRWPSMVRYVDDDRLPIDNNPVERAIRTITLGRKSWLFAGSLSAGQRAAAITSLIATAKQNGHDPHAYLKDVLTRLPTHTDRRIGELLPHRWKPAT
jgi:transposase